MSNPVIHIEDVSKLYRLGEVGTGTLRHDLNRWWHQLRGLQDPYLKYGEENSRTQKGGNYVWALQNISFQVNRGDVIGIIGRNGAGKSTLLKIMSKITAPTSGHIKISGRVASLLEVGTGFHPDMTGRDNAFMNGALLGMRRAEVKRKLDEIIEFAGVARYIDTPVKRYSSGMKVRLGFAVAAHLEPEILIVDEVLAVGDAEFQQKCLGKMQDVSRTEGRTILFVSHNMAAIARLCSRAVLLNNGKLEMDGSIQTVVSRYLEHSIADSEIEFEQGIVRRIEIRQQETDIYLSVVFESDTRLDKPIIGFVISDQHGNKICGSNPIHQRPDFLISSAFAGKIEVLITSPKLLSGRYQLSVWFADGILGVLASHEQVLNFEVINMHPFDQEPNVQTLGPVVAIPIWKYTYSKQ